MGELDLVQSLLVRSQARIVYLVLDGLGGLPGDDGRTELECARLPNLDALARESACGLLDPVAPGITPGSGPGHLALFGYDPVAYNIGRGVVSALGVEFALAPDDVAARLNFATVDSEGRIVDRRAGRLPDAENRRLVAKLTERVRGKDGVEVFFATEKEHRAVLVLRGPGLGAELNDTDPQQVGVPPLALTGPSEADKRTAAIVEDVLRQAREVLAGEPKANMLLARGFAKFRPYPTMAELFGLRAAAFADYPFYRGVARLVGMEVFALPGGWRAHVGELPSRTAGYDFIFLHVKDADARGEDGDFAAKIAALEAADAIVPAVRSLNPDVLVVTGDHSTPARLRAHSWHPVPVALWARSCRRGGTERFDERSCAQGSLGRLAARHLLPVALAHAGRLKKFGA